MKKMFVFCAMIFLGSTSQALCDNFRCPNGNIVSSGDSISTVAAKCDSPANIFTREEPIETEYRKDDGKTGSKTIYVETQEWSYNQGSTLLHTLIFRNGVLSKVITGGFVQ